MLYGQNLPWRSFLRRSASSRISSLSPSTPYTPFQSRISRPCRTPLNARYRAFSSSPLNRREDADRKAQEESEEKTDVDASKRREEEASKLPESTDAKTNKPPEPIPSGKSSDGKGSTAGGGDSGGDSGSGNNSTGGSGGGGRRRKNASDRSLQKPTVPEVYPQVMAIPIAKRPLFPGFYKAITIRNPEVMAAIDAAMKMGQPYIGAFLLRDENADIDVIEKMGDVHEVGTFCQITSAFTVQGEEASMTAVLYPHRRIKMSSLSQTI
jgi:Lon-like ATP-dependent protease